jgi:hypothetical protein
MEKRWISQAEETIQVSEDEWRRRRVSLELKPETTVQEIVSFFEGKQVDFRTGILLLEINTL